MRSDQLPEDLVPWGRALREALATPALEDALACVLERLTPLTGALASAFALPRGGRPLATWQCDAQAVGAALVAGEPNPEMGTAGDPSLPEGFSRFVRADGEAGGVLVVPAGVLEPPGAVLLLFYPAEGEPGAAERESAGGLAALGGLLLEREFLTTEATRAREARDHFLVAIHHELRTPATAVMLEAGLLQTGMLGTLPPRLEGAIGKLESHVGELVRVIQRVLDLSRLQADGGGEAEDLVDPRSTVIEIARRVEPTAERRGIAVSLFFPRMLPVLQTDASRFRRVLLCLLANALKYTDAGRVQVKCERVTRSIGAQRREPFLLVRVVDTGRGIPEEEIERVFEPFAQVEEGARTDSGMRGVGLGLSLARKLARSLGGDVTVESTLGQGTTALLAIPYRQPRPG